MPAIAKSPGVERFDADAVGDRIILRHWRRGDRFRPIGMPSAVKLQDLFANARVPKAERHQRLVATTANGEIFWVEGLRISEGFKLHSETRRLLEWKWRRRAA
jgi:tRNA(Ile)-lysidine synthase